MKIIEYKPEQEAEKLLKDSLSLSPTKPAIIHLTNCLCTLTELQDEEKYLTEPTDFYKLFISCFELLIDSQLNHAQAKARFLSILEKFDFSEEKNKKFLQAFKDLRLLFEEDELFYDNQFKQQASYKSAIKDLLVSHLKEIIKKPWLRNPLYIQRNDTSIYINYYAQKAALMSSKPSSTEVQFSTEKPLPVDKQTKG